MKKILLTSVYAAAMIFGMTACGGDRAAKTETATDTVSRRYVGTLPAADGPGIVYDLTLIDPAGNSSAGDFRLSMTYLEAENGKDMRFDSEGEWTIKQGISGDSSAVFYRLVESGLHPDTTDFLDLGDSVVLLGPGLQRVQSQLNYTLIRTE